MIAVGGTRIVNIEKWTGKGFILRPQNSNKKRCTLALIHGLWAIQEELMLVFTYWRSTIEWTWFKRVGSLLHVKLGTLVMGHGL